jgi:nitroreductase
MDFFEAIEKRRSIRRFRPESFPRESVQRALEAAILAPNSSNVQTWDFHWPINPDIKARVVKACLSQSAARTASEIVVVTADPSLWRRSRGGLIEWVKDAGAPKPVLTYYQSVIPVVYSWGIFNVFAPFKWIVSFATGLVRPMVRGPHSRQGLNEVAIKSAALAAENFVLAITALGGATCMMEGFDECRMKRALGLKSTTRVVMAIGIGFEAEKGTWGPRYRLPLKDVVHVHE